EGRPILYGLGNFFFQSGSVDRVPADELVRRGLPPDAGPAEYRRQRSAGGERGPESMAARWQSVVAVAEFGADGLASLTLHPVDLGRERHRALRGVPLPASRGAADEVTARIRERSAAFGTEWRKD